MSRFFTLPEAEAMLPRVEKKLREALFLKSQYQSAEEELRAIARKVQLSGGALVNRDHVSELRNQRSQHGGRLQEIFGQIQEMGCLVKDLDIGLIDFPTLYKDQEVYLCWRLGEGRIQFWHPIETGFGGRQEIDAEFLANHRGGDEE